MKSSSNNKEVLTMQRPLKFKSGDIAIQGNSIIECKRLAKMARRSRQSPPVRLKIGPISIVASSLIRVATVGVLGMGLWAGYKSINKTKAKDVSSDNKEKEPNQLPPSKMETLNETIQKCKSSNYGISTMEGGFIRYGGINLIFSPTGEGKSILVMQMGIEIATGKASQLVSEDHSLHPPMAVVVYDEEQDEDDIVDRYGKNGQTYPNNLHRKESCMFDDDNVLTEDISKTIGSFESDVCVIIDNLTSIIPTLSSNKVRKFYKRLKQIQKNAKDQGRRITFIVVAHTIKGYSDKFTLKDLAGSANISNFLNNAIVLIPTKYGEQMKMLKLLKNRNNLKGDGIILKIVPSPYIHFEYQRTAIVEDAAPEHIQKSIASFLNGETASNSNTNKPVLPKEELRKKAWQMRKHGMTGKAIANKLGVNEMMISRIFNDKKRKIRCPINTNTVQLETTE